MSEYSLHLVPGNSLYHLQEIHYCVNCIDVCSGTKGTFAYDVGLMSRCGMVAISPIFEDVMQFYLWAKGQGFRYHNLTQMFVLTREFV